MSAGIFYSLNPTELTILNEVYIQCNFSALCHNLFFIAVQASVPSVSLCNYTVSTFFLTLWISRHIIVSKIDHSQFFNSVMNMNYYWGRSHVVVVWNHIFLINLLSVFYTLRSILWWGFLSSQWYHVLSRRYHIYFYTVIVKNTTRMYVSP